MWYAHKANSTEWTCEPDATAAAWQFKRGPMFPGPLFLQITKNAEVTNVMKILGLVHKDKFENKEDLKSLRYGKVRAIRMSLDVCCFYVREETVSRI